MGKFGKILFWCVLVAVGAACVGASYYVRNSAEAEVGSQATSAREEARRIQEQVVLYWFPRGFLFTRSWKAWELMQAPSRA
jgi:DhnA family fructose-bisphosphate aldolase class Ia